jgi:HK97 family phage major capsid protein
MSAKNAQWYADASETELRARAAEMRGEYSTLSESRRDNPDAYDTAIVEFKNEVETLDVQLGLRAKAEAPVETRSMPAGARGGVETRSLGELGISMEYAQARSALTNPEFRSWLDSGGRGSSPRIELRADVVEASGIGSDWLPPKAKFWPVPRQRRLTIRDLLTVIPTTNSNHEYVRELNPATNQLGASTVAESATKPDQLYETQIDTAPVRTIAALTTITHQAIQDESTLVAYINNALTYRIRLREELEILFGNGISPDLKGLLNFAGVQTQSTAGAGEYAITLANAIAKVVLADGEPDGIVMNPTTYYAMVSHRVAGGSNAAGGGVFDTDAYTSTPSQYVWGLPTVISNSAVANQNIVGNWKQAGWLFDREAPSVQVFEQHQDYAATNKVLLRCEERVALACPRPDLLVVATTS